MYLHACHKNNQNTKENHHVQQRLQGQGPAAQREQPPAWAAKYSKIWGREKVIFVVKKKYNKAKCPIL